MTFMIVIPADLDRLIQFFKHLFEMIKNTYPEIMTAEIKLEENSDGS